MRKCYWCGGQESLYRKVYIEQTEKGFVYKMDPCDFFLCRNVQCLYALSVTVEDLKPITNPASGEKFYWQRGWTLERLDN